MHWLGSITATMGAQVIPIDGKTLRGSYDREAKQSALCFVSAWLRSHRLVLGQLKVNSKSNAHHSDSPAALDAAYHWQYHHY